MQSAVGAQKQREREGGNRKNNQGCRKENRG